MLPTLGGVTLVFYFLLLKYVVLTQSMNLIAGYTGYIDFGHVVWFGIGTYVVGMLHKSQPALDAFPFITPVVAGTVAAFLAVVVGMPLLRLRGPYFAISMLVFNESVRVLVTLLEPYTGGPFGISYVTIYNPVAGYYAMLVLAVGIMIFTRYLSVSRFGVALKAIREDEDAADVMGIHTTRYKATAFGLSAFFAAVAGGIDFWFVSYTSPELAFNLVLTIEMVVMMMFGGAGTALGPIVGASSLFIVRDYVWARYPALYLMLFGGVIIGAVLFMPRGLLGALENRVGVLRGRIK